jgi:LysM repeat protein
MKIKFRVPKLPGKTKRLRATAARRPLRIAATEYEEMAEPNMKLSRALLIVLVLHIVAVSGIIAFNAIKTHQSPMPARINPTSEPSAPLGPIVEIRPATAHSVIAQKETLRREESKAAHTPSKPSTKAADDAHKTYTVAKGDNPVTIAKRLKVPYDELLALNHIDDPRKLQIGQRLLLPSKTTKTKKGEE